MLSAERQSEGQTVLDTAVTERGTGGRSMLHSGRDRSTIAQCSGCLGGVSCVVMLVGHFEGYVNIVILNYALRNLVYDRRIYMSPTEFYLFFKFRTVRRLRVPHSVGPSLVLWFVSPRRVGHWAVRSFPLPNFHLPPEPLAGT